MHKLFENKKILLIVPKFFGYEVEVYKELEKLGASVDYYDERPKNNFFTKACLRLRLRVFINKLIANYYSSILNQIKHNYYDYILVIKPESVTKSILVELKILFPQSKLIIYMWDSIQNNKGQMELLDVCDKFITFDPHDSKIYPKVNFLPLFYIEDYGLIGRQNSKAIFDYSFIGTAHSDRYKVIKDIQKLLQIHNLKFYLFLYSPSKVIFFLRKCFDKKFRKFNLSEVSFKLLSKNATLSIIQNSKVIIDIEHPKQKGLTMRTIEMLGAKKKLITTNGEIVNYNFYDPKNILVINRNNIEIDLSIFDGDYQDVDKNVYESYSLKNWLVEVFK